MWALGRHPVGIALEDDPAAVEDHEAVGIRLVEELGDAQLPEVDRSGRKLPHIRRIVWNIGRRDELAHVVERPALSSYRHSNWSSAREYRASDGWCWTAIRTMSWISKLYGSATMGRDVVRSVTGSSSSTQSPMYSIPASARWSSVESV